MNPAVLPDGSNISNAPAPKTDPHICNRMYGNVDDLELPANDIHDAPLHTASAHATDKRNVTPSLFNHNQLLSWQKCVLLTAWNDGMINSFNPVQLSPWLANVHMQYIVSRCRVIEYCTKDITKSEPQSQPLKEVFTTIDLISALCRF